MLGWRAVGRRLARGRVERAERRATVATTTTIDLRGIRLGHGRESSDPAEEAAALDRRHRQVVEVGGLDKAQVVHHPHAEPLHCSSDVGAEGQEERIEWGGRGAGERGEGEEEEEEAERRNVVNRPGGRHRNWV